MHEIEVVLKEKDKLIISLPEPAGGQQQQQLIGRTPVARIRVQRNWRRNLNHLHHYRQHQQQQHHQHQANGHISYRAGRRPNPFHGWQAVKPLAGQTACGNWERVVEDRVKMIEMHAF